jgi:hypothetical protein
VWVGLVVASLPAQAKVWPVSSCDVSDGDQATYQLGCRFDLELWEDGEKAADTFEQWSLGCLGTTTSCTLTQTIVRISSVAGWLVENVQYSDTNVDHSDRLRVRRADWKRWDTRGQLDFDLINSANEVTVVTIQLQRQFKSSLRVFDIDRFQARRDVRHFSGGALISQEWRIPEYSYTVNVPFVIGGKRDPEEKNRDELKSRLSAADWQLFEGDTISSCFEHLSKEDQERFASLMDPDGQFKDVEAKMKQAQGRALKKLEAQGEAMLAEADLRPEVQQFWRSKLDECLSRAGMSTSGRQLVVAFIMADMFPSGVRPGAPPASVKEEESTTVSRAQPRPSPAQRSTIVPRAREYAAQFWSLVVHDPWRVVGWSVLAILGLGVLWYVVAMVASA